MELESLRLSLGRYEARTEYLEARLARFVWLGVTQFATLSEVPVAAEGRWLSDLLDRFF